MKHKRQQGYIDTHKGILRRKDTQSSSYLKNYIDICIDIRIKRERQTVILNRKLQ